MMQIHPVKGRSLLEDSDSVLLDLTKGHEEGTILLLVLRDDAYSCCHHLMPQYAESG